MRVVPIHGTIEEAGLPDVLHLLTLGQKTGCLAVSDGDQSGEIYLEAGRIAFAEVAARRERFGELLVKSRRITREQLTIAAAEQAEGGRPLSHILVDSGHIEREKMERLVRLQVEEAVYQLFSWKSGEFSFTPNRRPSHPFLVLSLDPESLLLEGARRVDEWGLIQKKIPSFDLVYRRSGSSLGLAAADLSEEQKRILPLLDGTHDVSSLIEISGLSEFDAGKALYGLLQAGFASLLERRSRVRHLEYREVLAYLVHEAEFADSERRQDAARHIADCLSCAKRLRNIHVRRTHGSGEDRRARDRRQFERRAGLDRRNVVNGASQMMEDRRAAPRRGAERRGTGTSRRSSDTARRADVTSIATPVPLRPAAVGRRTEARRMPPERRGYGRPTMSAAAGGDGRKPDPPAPGRNQTPSTPAVPPPTKREPSRDLVWITTPEESAEMMRRLSQSRAMPAVPPTPPARVPPTPPVQTTQASTPAPAPPPVAAVPKPTPTPAGRAAASPKPQPRPTPGPRRTVHAKRQAHRARRLTIAAVIGGVALAGYGAMQLGRGGDALEAPPTSVAVSAVVTPAPELAPAPAPSDPVRTAETVATTGGADPAPARPVRAPEPTPAPAPLPPSAREPSRGAGRSAAAAVHMVTAAALAPDSELAAGGWTTVDRAEARSILGGTLAAIQGLRIESIATSSVGGRPRVRVAQIVRSGQRIVLTQMLSGTGTARAARASDVSVSQASEVNPLSIGTASIGSVFVTARSSIPAEVLRPLLQRLAEVR